MHMWEGRRAQTWAEWWVSASVSFHFVSLRQGLLLNPELTFFLQLASPNNHVLPSARRPVQDHSQLVGATI